MGYFGLVLLIFNHISEYIDSSFDVTAEQYGFMNTKIHEFIV